MEGILGMMRNLLVSDCRLGVCICAHFGLLPILDIDSTDLGSGRPQTSGLVLSPYLTSQAPASTSNAPSTPAQASAAHTILPLVVQVMRLMDGNVIHGLNDS